LGQPALISCPPINTYCNPREKPDGILAIPGQIFENKPSEGDFGP
jgi:hypothetical protein